MADFVAVLKRTIDGLGETTPEMRQKVYAKARATIAAKLAAVNPPPPAAAAERQKQALEDAIVAVEADYAIEEPEVEQVDDDLDSFIASLGEEASAAAAVREAPEQTVPVPDAGRDAAADLPEMVPPEMVPPEAIEAPPVAERAPAPQKKSRTVARRGSGGNRRLVAGLVVLVLAAGAAYAAWLNRDEVSDLLGLAGFSPTPAAISTAPAEDEDEPAEAAVEAPPTEQAETEIAAVEPDTSPAEEPQSEPAEAAAPEVQKFTQRLLPDGREVDEGPAAGAAGVGEGTSIAAASAPPPAAPAEAAEEAAEAAPGEQAAAGGPAPLAVGQRAIFYEERTASAQGSAETGSILWSLVQESPGGDLPPEPAIRAEATIPGMDLQLRMTIRRNGDDTLPASHIVEIIFLTPEGFGGGGIENVMRMTMKGSEEAPGLPLQGIPAKIADGFFLLALADGQPAVEANLGLMRDQNWIDIPMVYRSGRRALITLEKGIPGERVFNEAFEAWRAATSG